MKSNLLPVLALSLLLGACTTNPNTSAYIDPNPAVSAGIKDTKWGQLPSYEPAGHRFTRLSLPNIESLNAGGVVKLDLFVNQDGTVRDVAIFESSSNPAVDKATAAMFKNARYSLKLSPDDPAPYVVRFTMGIRSTAGGDQGQEFVDRSMLGSLGPQADYSGPPRANYSYSTLTP